MAENFQTDLGVVFAVLKVFTKNLCISIKALKSKGKTKIRNQQSLSIAVCLLGASCQRDVGCRGLAAWTSRDE